MGTGAITGYFDVAQVTLYAFWAFFAYLIIYLRREDKREGYPLIEDGLGNGRTEGWPPLPPAKTFRLPHGGVVYAPRPEDPQPPISAEPTHPWPGSPLEPIGNPLLSGAGPAASALRSNEPDRTYVHGEPRILPMRVATDHYLDEESPDPRGLKAVGADGVVGGDVSDIWVDRSEMVVRYLEVTLPTGGSVLVPMPLIRVNETTRKVVVRSVMGKDFAAAPKLANPDLVTLREEDQISAYFASGQLYATPDRRDPFL